jgi:hypothetical protein
MSYSLGDSAFAETMNAVRFESKEAAGDERFVRIGQLTSQPNRILETGTRSGGVTAYINDDGSSSFGSSGVTTFIGLTDTPASYSAAGRKILQVNGGANAVEFTSDPNLTTLTTNGTITCGTDLTVSGSAIINGDVTAAGHTTLNGDVTAASGTTALNTLTVSGGSYLNTLTTSGAITVGTDLTVTGTTTLNGDVNAPSGTTTVNNLVVNGTDTTINGNMTFGDTKVLTMPGNSGITCNQLTAGIQMIKKSYTFNPPVINTTGGNDFTMPAVTSVSRVIIKSTVTASMTGISGNIFGISASQVSFSTGRVGISFNTGHLYGFPKLVNWTLGQGSGGTQANWYYEVNFDSDLSVYGRDIILELDFNQND